MVKSSERPVEAQNPFQTLFSQYRRQGQLRDEAFQTSLTAFRTRMQRLRRLEPQIGILDYVKGMALLRSQFDAYIQTLRQLGLLEFTLPINLALAWVRIQWFWQYQGPQVRHGWQQAFNQGGLDQENL
ncbi:MAG: hypothetical protein AAFR42_01705 [Cyanobacteria bacterium J06628_6]